MTLPHLSFEQKKQNKPDKEKSLPDFESCCCISLRTGCILYGWTSLFIYAGVILACGYLHFSQTGDIGNHESIINSWSQIILHILLLKTLNFALLLLGLYKKNCLCLYLFMVVEVVSFVLFGLLGHFAYENVPINVYVVIGLIIYAFASTFMLFVINSCIVQIKSSKSDSQDHN